MASFIVVPSTDTDAKSPFDDALADAYRTNADYNKAQITAGASADQTIDTNKFIAQSLTGFGLDVKGDAIVRGDLTVSGQLITGSFFVSDLVQNFEVWA